jgi:chromosome segregation ATPase
MTQHLAPSAARTSALEPSTSRDASVAEAQKPTELSEVIAKNPTRAPAKSDALAAALFDAEQSRLHVVSLQRQLSSLRRDLLDAKRVAAGISSSGETRRSHDDQEVDQLKEKLEEARHALAATRASRSWRITAPLRWLRGG